MSSAGKEGGPSDAGRYGKEAGEWGCSDRVDGGSEQRCGLREERV